jgi:thioredoxin reductase
MYEVIILGGGPAGMRVAAGEGAKAALSASSFILA